MPGRMNLSTASIFATHSRRHPRLHSFIHLEMYSVALLIVSLVSVAAFLPSGDYPDTKIVAFRS